MAGETYQNLGGQTVEWGTAGVATNVAAGTILNATSDESGSTEPIENESGAVVGLTAYDSVTEIMLTILFEVGKTPPALWDIVTADGLSGYVSKVGKAWGNKQHKQITVGVTVHKHVTLSGGGT